MNEDVQRARTQENNNEKPPSPCREGYVWNPKTGGCEKEKSQDGSGPELEISKNVEAEDVTEDL